MSGAVAQPSASPDATKQREQRTQPHPDSSLLSSAFSFFPTLTAAAALATPIGSIYIYPPLRLLPHMHLH